MNDFIKSINKHKSQYRQIIDVINKSCADLKITMNEHQVRWMAGDINNWLLTKVVEHRKECEGETGDVEANKDTGNSGKCDMSDL